MKSVHRFKVIEHCSVFIGVFKIKEEQEFRMSGFCQILVELFVFFKLYNFGSYYPQNPGKRCLNHSNAVIRVYVSASKIV